MLFSSVGDKLEVTWWIFQEIFMENAVFQEVWCENLWKTHLKFIRSGFFQKRNIFTLTISTYEILTYAHMHTTLEHIRRCLFEVQLIYALGLCVRETQHDIGSSLITSCCPSLSHWLGGYRRNCLSMTEWIFRSHIECRTTVPYIHFNVYTCIQTYMQTLKITRRSEKKTTIVHEILLLEQFQFSFFFLFLFVYLTVWRLFSSIFFLCLS